MRAFAHRHLEIVIKNDRIKTTTMYRSCLTKKRAKKPDLMSG